LVQKADDVHEENEWLKQELRRERERQQQLIAIAGYAEPVLETKSNTLWLYGGVAILVAVGVIVGVTVQWALVAVEKPDTQASHSSTFSSDRPAIQTFPPNFYDAYKGIFGESYRDVMIRLVSGYLYGSESKSGTGSILGCE
jgi:hypothetical protein